MIAGSEQSAGGVNVGNLIPREGSFSLSLIVPVFNEDAAIESFFERVLPIVERTTPNYEIICVNDGSSDESLAKLMFAHLAHPRIKVIDLSRNFGKEAALTAGLDHASGDVVIPIDADLQDPPDLIQELVAKWRKGYDHVVAVRDDRRSDSLAKRSTASLFYRSMRRLSDMPIPAHAGDFRLLDRRVVKALKLLPERTRFMKGLFAWVGFRQATITYARPARVAGNSRWHYWKLWNFALDGILSSTTLPLRMWSYLGLAIAFGALVYMFYIVLRTLIHGIDVPGYASLSAMLLFFSGMNMIGLGIIGEYLGRVFSEVKQRPRYLVRDVIGFDSGSAVCPERVLAEGTQSAGMVQKSGDPSQRSVVSGDSRMREAEQDKSCSQ
jgi:glycosyltransferase involved in cell wall biosynthesis